MRRDAALCVRMALHRRFSILPGRNQGRQTYESMHWTLGFIKHCRALIFRGIVRANRRGDFGTDWSTCFAGICAAYLPGAGIYVDARLLGLER